MLRNLARSLTLPLRSRTEKDERQPSQQGPGLRQAHTRQSQTTLQRRVPGDHDCEAEATRTSARASASDSDIDSGADHDRRSVTGKRAELEDSEGDQAAGDCHTTGDAHRDSSSSSSSERKHQKGPRTRLESAPGSTVKPVPQPETKASSEASALVPAAATRSPARNQFDHQPPSKPKPYSNSNSNSDSHAHALANSDLNIDPHRPRSHRRRRGLGQNTTRLSTASRHPDARTASDTTIEDAAVLLSSKASAASADRPVSAAYPLTLAVADDQAQTSPSSSSDEPQPPSLEISNPLDRGTQPPSSPFVSLSTAEVVTGPGAAASSAAITAPVHLNRDDLGVTMQRKVWVKRPGASATRVEVQDDDLIDNVRDVILHKYANSLGRSIDSPDITLKIVSREQANTNVAAERVLSPEESVGRTLDAYYPGGQAINEALIIEVPQRRTPKPSPRPGNHMSYYIPEEYRPGEAARDYFPPMPLHSPRLAHVPHTALPNGTLPVHSMSVLTTGQVPPLPSPGTHSGRRHVRPKYGRQHTSSPTIMHTSQPGGLDPKTHLNGGVPTAPPLPTPPASADHKTNTITPPNRTTSPHPGRQKKKKPNVGTRDPNAEPVLPSKPASAGLLDGRVPPINVLIVEDNVINLRLLEQFMRRLKVRWKSAMNGKEAVSVWRQGGFHLVLMDIQLPVMNGLEATKEIRRLESVNGIGISVFGESSSHGSSSGFADPRSEVDSEDKLEDRSLFKSPVIIVALTASSLQSDRHEALAVGCNDFLTKPVNFGWMERKVTEWGCMQALIDFDGWRKWKEIEAKKASMDPEKRKLEEKEEKAKAKAALRAMFSRPPPAITSSSTKKDEGDAKKDEKDSLTISGSSSMVTSPTAIEPGPTPGLTNGNGHNNAAGSGRRTYRGSRSGNSISSLPATVEVDELEPNNKSGRTGDSRDV